MVVVTDCYSSLTVRCIDCLYRKFYNRPLYLYLVLTKSFLRKRGMKMSYKYLKLSIFFVLIVLLSNLLVQLAGKFLTVDGTIDNYYVINFMLILNPTLIILSILYAIAWRSQKMCVFLHKIKINIIPLCFSTVVILIIFEGFSFFILRSGLVKLNEEEKEILFRFPAQLRASRSELATLFPQLPIFLQHKVEFYGFDFDPVLGFKLLWSSEFHFGSDYLSFFDNEDTFVKECKDKFLIVTFGGSTTVGGERWGNWPRFLIQSARKQKIDKPIMVLNAGHLGYSSFNEKIFFSHWILPVLERNNIKPDLVISLDGVNDIVFSLMGYVKSVKSPNWYASYHGYHQRLDNDIRSIITRKGSFNFYQRSYSTIFSTIISRISPYTLKLLSSLTNPLPKITLPIQKDEQSNEKILVIPEVAERKVIKGFQNNLLDFFGICEIRGIHYISYLQPVCLEGYYPLELRKGKELPTIEYAGKGMLLQDLCDSPTSDMGGDFIIPMKNIYNEADKVYANLNKKYPGHFKSLIKLFLNVENDIFEWEGVHYSKQGSKMIADAIMQNLIDENLIND